MFSFHLPCWSTWDTTCRRAGRREGLTQTQLAKQCDLHRTFIGSVERGERNVSILNLRLIARVLRVERSELLSEWMESEE